MHLNLVYTPVESELSTPSDIFDSPASSEQHEAFSTDFFAMAEHNYSDQFGRLSAPSQDWTPSSAVRYSNTDDPRLRRGNSNTLYSYNDQVSSFNLPLIYDSTLTTPVSLNPESPNPHGKAIHSTQWGRVDYQSLRNSEGIYINTNSMSMKSKNDSLTLAASDADNMLSISPYVFDSPATPCPPTPYWGSFSVSAPQPNNAPTSTTTPNPNPSQNIGMASGARGNAPILMAPNPSNLRPRQNSQEHDQAQKQHQMVQPIQMKAQPSQPHHMPSQVTHIKRECSSPALPPKRRRRSAPPVEQHKPLTRDEISDEDRILLHLRDIKEEEKWDWKELTERFNRQTGGKHNLAALQMRHTRLVERMRIWTDVEINALNRAKVQYDNQKWKTIAETMLEYGCQTKWSPHACQMKWQELHPNDDGGYDTGSGYGWADNTTTASPPARKGSSISAQEADDGDEDAADRSGFTPNLGSGSSTLEQTQRLQIPHRGSGASSRSASGNRASRNVYEQRQEWTVRPQQ